MKKKIAVILLLLLSISVYLVYSNKIASHSSALTASGTIEATKVQLNAKVAGTIDKIFINSGDKVTKGQLVAQISRNDIAAQVERDKLAVLQAEAKLEDLLSGARDQEIKAARARVKAAEAVYKQTLNSFERTKALYEAEAVSQAELEKIETELKVQENNLEAARAKLSLLEAGSRENNIKEAELELERRKAILDASKALLEDTKVISPIDGTVLTKNREEGEFVPTGVSIAKLVNLEDMWIKVYVPTDELPNIKLGQKVYFTVSGCDKKFPGEIEEIASQGEFTPKTIQTKQERTNIVYEVKIKINDHGGILKPGMPADVVFGDKND